MQKLLDDQGDNLVNLAADIVEHGMSPIDNMLVIRSAEDASRCVVLEGNRRLLALKILSSPSVMGDLVLKAGQRDRYRALAAEYKKNPVAKVSCFEVEDRKDSVHWIRLRHMGENSGRGTVQWRGPATARFSGDHPALQALEFVAAYGGLSEAERDKVLGTSFPITTLDRLIMSTQVRRLLGFDVQQKKFVSGLHADELVKPLRRIVLDLANKVKTVTDLKRSVQQVAYIKSFGKADSPDLKNVGAVRPIEEIHLKDFTARVSVKRKRRVAAKGARKVMIEKGTPLNVTDPKVSEIAEELRSLEVERHPHACAVLLRVFLELSVDAYLSKHHVSLEIVTPGGKVPKKLGKKASEAIEHLITIGGHDGRTFRAIDRAMSDKRSPLHIDLLHQYLHNRFTKSKPRDLFDAWDEARPFFENIWP